MQEDELREKIKRFCRTEEAVDNLMTIIKQYSKDYADRDRQDKLIDFIQDPENIKKAVEGSMRKRQKVLDTPIGDNSELREQVKQKIKLMTCQFKHNHSACPRINANSMQIKVLTDEVLVLIQEQQKALIDRIEKELKLTDQDGELHYAHVCPTDNVDCARFKQRSQTRHWQTEAIKQIKEKLS